MLLIEWDDSFNLGHDELDRQHRKWIAIFRKAHEIMMNGTYEDLSHLGEEAVSEMVEYGKEHFAFEEAYMKEIGYPDMEHHKYLHDLFMKQIDQRVLELHRGDHVLNSEILKMMENWLKHHILVEDRKLISFMNGNNEDS